MKSPTEEALAGIEQARSHGEPVFKSADIVARCGFCGAILRVVSYHSNFCYTVYFTCMKCLREEIHGRNSSTRSHYEIAKAEHERRVSLTSGYHGRKEKSCAGSGSQSAGS